MKKNILLFASLIASVFVAGSCQKYEVKEAVDENATVSSFTVKATLGATSGEGMKTTIAADDVLRVRFTDEEGNTFGRIQTLYNTTGAGASATFSAKSVAVPNGAKKFIVFLDSRASGKINFGTTPTTADFTKQDGTLKSAQGLQMIMGVGEIANEASVTLAYATSIVKAELSFPEGVTPIIGETTITLAVNEFNKMVIANNNDDSKYTTGNLTVNAVVDTVKKTASAYIALVSQDGNLKKGTIFSEFGGTKYGCDVDGAKIEPGKTFSVKEETIVLVYSYYIPDEQYVITNVTGNKVSGDACITVSGGTLTIAENTTGKIRNSSVILDNGKEYKFTQVGVNEFKGSWTFTSKRFSNITTVMPAGNPVGTNDLTIGAPLLGETLADFSGNTYTNQVGITGLYQTAVADACIDIDYKTKTARIGIFLDARDNAQKVATAFKGKEYVCFLPEMGGGVWSSPWNFIQVDLDSKKDYCWIWFEGNEDFTKFTYDASKGSQKMTGDKAVSTANTIIGITVAASSSNKVNSESVTGANVIGANGGNYPIIFQGNPNNSGAQFTLVKK